MTIYSSHFKQQLLLKHRSNSHRFSFRFLAGFYGGGLAHTTIERWYNRWNGTEESLERREGSGVHRLLSREEAKDTIDTIVRASNRNHDPINYSSIHREVEEKTGSSLSLSTLRRYGHEDAGIRYKRTKIRTEQESKYMYNIYLL